MKLIDFLKSTAFKCIVVLLCIALISGGTLSILNDVLEVTKEEQLQRVIDSLYDDPTAKAEEYTVPSDMSENGAIETVYVLSDGNLIIKSTGGEGYKGGTVTMWVIATIKNGDFSGIKNISIASYDKQTLMSQFTGKVLAKYIENSGDYVTAGATYSSKAVTNAIKAATAFAKAYCEKEAK